MTAKAVGKESRNRSKQLVENFPMLNVNAHKSVGQPALGCNVSPTGGDRLALGLRVRGFSPSYLADPTGKGNTMNWKVSARLCTVKPIRCGPSMPLFLKEPLPLRGNYRV